MSHARRDIFLNSLLHTYHPQEAGQLLSYLPVDQQERIQKLPSTTPQSFSLLSERACAAIHYSWRNRVLSDLPESVQKLYNQENALTSFFRADLCKRLGVDHILPQEALPERPLNVLLHVDKRHFVRLIGFLGLRDLANELRHNVDRRVTVQLNQYLSAAQQRYIASCIRQQEPFSPEPLGLKAWLIDRYALNRHAQKRGLARLGAALALEDRSLIWHLVHKLDFERGRLLERETGRKINPRMAERLGGQVVELLNRLANET